MTWKKLQRLLACLLAVLLLSQVGAFLPTARAAGGYSLQNGSAIIKSTMTTDEVNHALTRALVVGFDQMSEADQNALLGSLTWEYYCDGKGKVLGVPATHTDWGTINGFTSVNMRITYTHPALAQNDDGNYQVRVAGTTAEVTLKKLEKIESSIELKQDASVKLPYNEDGTLNADALRAAIFAQVVENTTPELTVSDVTIEYYATAESGSFVGIGKAWMPLEGGTKDLLTYPAIGEGTQEVRITWGGSKDYAAWQWTGNVDVTGREAAPFQLKQGVTEVSIVYNADQSINYAATAQALRDALLESTDPNVSINDVTVEYNAGTKELKNFQPLDFNGIGFKFGLNGQTIRFTWRGNADYQAYTQEVDVTMVDNRQPTEVALKPSISIVYNMDASVMEQNIFEYVIDWDDSTLPDKSTLSADDFTIEYYATPTVTVGNIGGDVGLQKWVPIEGEDGLSVGELQYFYPQMGAGDQKIRVTFKGDEAYRPSDAKEGNLTVKKAKVSVKVHSTSIYADEELSKDFITTDPADNFDIFTLFGGVTSDVTGSVFVQLPERLTKGTIIDLIDKTLEGLGQKTLTQMMQEGTTVGELRKLLSEIVAKGDDLPQPVKDLLKKAGIDIDTLVKLNEALNKFPGLLDNVRVAFGTPDQAGIYTVCAVTNNKNYETGFGMGALVVKKHYSGVKLQWNQTIPNGKLTAEQAADFDFSVTLMYNGEPAAKQTNVHYLYSGFTSKWKPYSSTTTPPTEPGRYVMTVVTLGGNYQAAPITRSFQITK